MKESLKHKLNGRKMSETKTKDEEIRKIKRKN